MVLCGIYSPHVDGLVRDCSHRYAVVNFEKDKQQQQTTYMYDRCFWHCGGYTFIMFAYFNDTFVNNHTSLSECVTQGVDFNLLKKYVLWYSLDFVLILCDEDLSKLTKCETWKKEWILIEKRHKIVPIR